MLKVEMGPDCLPNCELSLLFGRLTPGHSPVGREVQPVQGSWRSAQNMFFKSQIGFTRSRKDIIRDERLGLKKDGLGIRRRSTGASTGAA